MHERSRSPIRFLAPIALIVAALIFLVVLAGGITGGDEGSGGGTQAAEQGRGGGGGGGGGQRNRSAPETYEVQEGDTLDAISAETGVSVEQIQERNPDLDPQALIAGQELQLSE